MSKKDFEKICQRFFREMVRPVEDKSRQNVEQIMAIMYLFMDCPSKEIKEITSS